MKAFYLLAAGLFLAAVSCERHSWEETKILHESHDGHDDHDKGGDKHGDKHQGEDHDDHEGHNH